MKSNDWADNEYCVFILGNVDFLQFLFVLKNNLLSIIFVDKLA